MSEPIDEVPHSVATPRLFLYILCLAMLATTAISPASAGPIRPNVKAKTMAILQKTSADPWGPYWKAALKYHWKDVHSPRGVTMLKVQADGTVAESAFVSYLSWRQSLNAKRFNTYHPALMRLLRRVRPSAIPPMATPIQPPNFTPTEPSLPQGLNPPQIPEPATGLMAILMVGSAIAARRWAGKQS